MHMVELGKEGKKNNFIFDLIYRLYVQDFQKEKTMLTSLYQGLKTLVKIEIKRFFVLTKKSVFFFFRFSFR